MRSNVNSHFPLIIVFVAVGVATAAQKPSPFTPRKSEPAVPPAAPVAPVAPVHGARSQTVVASPSVQVSPVVAPQQAPVGSRAVVVPAVVSPVNRVVVPRGEPDIVDVTPDPAPVPAAAAAPIEVVVAKPVPVQDVAVGFSREQVLSKLGRPATSVSMYNDTNFVESMRYEWRGRWIGTVRLTNGMVTRVEAP
jgi:hypothetical protein